MDRISDSGSDGCGSIPHGGTTIFSYLTNGAYCHDANYAETSTIQLTIIEVVS